MSAWYQLGIRQAPIGSKGWYIVIEFKCKLTHMLM
jgi:hypothetical protein